MRRQKAAVSILWRLSRLLSPSIFRFPLALLMTMSMPALSFAAFRDLGTGARGPGMGNAFTAIADDVYAIHYNPAGLSLLSRPEVGTSHSQLLAGLGDRSGLSQTFLGYAHPLEKGMGTVAGSWQQFALGGIYQEHTFKLAYARLASESLGPGKLYAGIAPTLLYRRFGIFSEAGRATSGLFVTSAPDPVLSRGRSQMRPDVDLGLLYKLRDYYSVGLLVDHALQPNIAFNPADKERVAMGIKLGLNYGSLLSNIGFQYETRSAPDRLRDHNFVLAVERWFPRLMIGDFGIRAALNEGTRGLRVLSAGMSYRTQRFRVDYAFAMPINSVAGTVGTHRMGVSVRFGSLMEADESVLMILEAMRQLKKGQVPKIKTVGLGLTPSQKALLDEHLAFSNSLRAQAKYREALERLGNAISVSPGDTELLKAYGRLNWVATQVKELPNYKYDPLQSSWHEGILAYLAGDEASSVVKVSEALALDPTHKTLEGFLAQLELSTGLKRLAVAKAEPAEYKLAQKLSRAAVAVDEGRYDEAITLSLDVLDEDQTKVAAWESLGTSYFALGDYANSLTAWEKAHALENDRERRAGFTRYIRAIRKIMSRPKPVAKAPEAAPAAPDVPGPTAPEVRLSPRDIQQLYNVGIDFYTAGKLDEARRAFEKVLELDPAYVPAAKALKRVIEEAEKR